MTRSDYAIFKRVLGEISEKRVDICTGDIRCINCPYFHVGYCEIFHTDSIENRNFLRTTDEIAAIIFGDKTVEDSKRK